MRTTDRQGFTRHRSHIFLCFCNCDRWYGLGGIGVVKWTLRSKSIQERFFFVFDVNPAPDTLFPVCVGLRNSSRFRRSITLFSPKLVKALFAAPRASTSHVGLWSCLVFGCFTEHARPGTRFIGSAEPLLCE